MKISSYIRNILLSALIVCGSAIIVNAQEKTDSVLSPVLRLNYLMSQGDTIKLSAEIFVRRDTGPFNLMNADIDFVASAGSETKTLGTKKTGDDGTVSFAVAPGTVVPVDKDGKTTYGAHFRGKGRYLEASSEVTYKPARLTISFSEEDSVKKILVSAFQIESNKEIKPLPKEKVSIYVPRMLSNLKIGEIELDDNGTGSLDYPGKIIGDSLGNLTIFAMIEENDNFGFVKGESSVKWGIPKHYILAEKPTRELWTPIAPLWMIVTLIIMLSGVWGHYIYAVIQLIMIKRHSRKKQENI